MKRRSRSRGQALAEFAMVIPLMLLMSIGALDLGRVVWALDSISNAAREGARHAIVHGGTPGMHTDGCSLGPGLTPAASCKTVDQIVQQKAVGAGGQLTVTVCYGPDCIDDSNTTTSNLRGTPVTVRVLAHLDLVAAGLIGMTEFTVQSSSTMLVSN
jgi:Flp pilus assembly protein TadG